MHVPAHLRLQVGARNGNLLIENVTAQPAGRGGVDEGRAVKKHAHAVPTRPTAMLRCTASRGVCLAAPRCIGDVPGMCCWCSWCACAVLVLCCACCAHRMTSMRSSRGPGMVSSTFAVHMNRTCKSAGVDVPASALQSPAARAGAAPLPPLLALLALLLVLVLLQYPPWTGPQARRGSDPGSRYSARGPAAQAGRMQGRPAGYTTCRRQQEHQPGESIVARAR